MSATASTPRQRKDLELAAYSVDQVCVILGLSKPTVYKLIGAGRLRSVLIGRRRVIPKGEIDRLLAEE
jgi:excisionase family DNA binding protein